MSIRAASVLDSEGLASPASQAVTPAVEKSQPQSQTRFGSGLEHFFTGDYAVAERQLTVAISLSPNDARYYYFRALARARQGNRFEAEQDLSAGAKLESREARSALEVGRALERIQGSERNWLEAFRHVDHPTAVVVGRATPHRPTVPRG